MLQKIYISASRLGCVHTFDAIPLRQVKAKTASSYIASHVTGCRLNLSLHVTGLSSPCADSKDSILLEKVHIKEKRPSRKRGVNRTVACVMHGETDDGEA